MLQVIHLQNTNIPSSHSNNKQNIPIVYHQLPKTDTFINPEDLKQKSELCRRFMDQGFCPYENRCKFAHGSHQLLKNNQINNKYKTKDCQNFRKNNCCMYGKRCNFIHKLPEKEPAPIGHFDLILELVRKETIYQSRLLSLLELI